MDGVKVALVDLAASGLEASDFTRCNIDLLPPGVSLVDAKGTRSVTHAVVLMPDRVGTLVRDWLNESRSLRWEGLPARLIRARRLAARAEVSRQRWASGVGPENCVAVRGEDHGQAWLAVRHGVASILGVEPTSLKAPEPVVAAPLDHTRVALDEAVIAEVAAIFDQPQPQSRPGENYTAGDGGAPSVPISAAVGLAISIMELVDTSEEGEAELEAEIKKVKGELAVERAELRAQSVTRAETA